MKTTTETDSVSTENRPKKTTPVIKLASKSIRPLRSIVRVKSLRPKRMIVALKSKK